MSATCITHKKSSVQGHSSIVKRKETDTEIEDECFNSNQTFECVNRMLRPHLFHSNTSKLITSKNFCLVIILRLSWKVFQSYIKITEEVWTASIMRGSGLPISCVIITQLILESLLTICYGWGKPSVILFWDKEWNILPNSILWELRALEDFETFFCKFSRLFI